MLPARSNASIDLTVNGPNGWFRPSTANPRQGGQRLTTKVAGTEDASR